MLANRLSEDPSVTVLLLEAGGSDRHPYFHMPAGFAKMTKGIASWGWSTVPQKHLDDRVLWYTQAKVIGGGSSINAQLYTRGNAARLRRLGRARRAAPAGAIATCCPISSGPRTTSASPTTTTAIGGPLGVSVPVNPLPISEAFICARRRRYGIPYNPDFNGARQEGVGHYQLTVQRRAGAPPPPSAYLKPVRGRPNLTVRTGVAGDAHRGRERPRRRRRDRRERPGER